MLRRAAASLVGLVAILLIVAGVPAGLWAAYGNPLPHEVSWAALHQLIATPAVDDGLFIHVVALIGWAAWLVFTLSVLVELVGQLSGRHISVPGLGRPQRLAAPLVTLLLAVFVAAPLLAGSGTAIHQTTSPATAAAPASTTSTSTPSSVAPLAPGDGAEASADTALTVGNAPNGTLTSPAPGRANDDAAARVAAGPSGQHDRATHDVVYTVRPGDALMTIAEDHYGDQGKWRKIAEANEHLVGRHGVNFLEVGWKLKLPDVPRPHADSSDEGSARSGDDYTVRPGDTLSEIADDAYGNEHAWPKIYRANPQIDDPDVIHVGERLDIPGSPRATAATKRDTTKTDTTGKNDSSKNDTGKSGHAPGPQVGNRAGVPANGGARPGQVNQAPGASSAPTAAVPPAAPTTPATVPTAAAPTPATAPMTAPTQAAGEQAPANASDTSPLVWAGAAASALLAVGVLGVISTRRRRSTISRRPGRRLPGYTPQAEQAVTALQNVSAPLTVAHLDLALRTLSASLRAAGQPLPRILAVRLEDDRLDARLAEPADTAPPRPFEASEDGLVWTLPVDRAELLLDAAEANQVAAPYPSLVTLGTDEDGAHVLVDLETVAALSVDTDGDEDDAHAILAALAFELATASWADDLHLTIAGACADLPNALGVDRARYIGHIGELLDDLEREAAETRDQLDEEHLADARQGRLGDATDAWTPHILLIGHALTEDETQRLAEILTALPRIAVAAVTTDPAQVTEWSLVATDPAELATLEPLGLSITPQRLSGDAYAAVCCALLESQSAATEPAPWWNHTAEDEADLDDDPETPGATHTIALLHPSTGTDLEDDLEPNDSSSGDNEATTTTAAAAVATPEAAQPEHDLIDASNDTLDTNDEVEAEDEPAAAGADTNGPVAAADVAVDLAPAVASTDCGLALDVDGDTTPELLGVGTREVGIAAPASLPRRPTLQVLGEVTVENITGTLASGRTASELLGVVVFLYLNPWCSTTAFKDAFAKRTYNTDELVSRTRRWLGNAEDGTPLLPKAFRRDGGRFYKLNDELRSDWALFHELTVGGVNTAPTTQLVDALRLVRGRPLASIPPDLLSSVEPWREEAASTIVDAALVLGARAIARGDLDLARWAVRRGTQGRRLQRRPRSPADPRRAARRPTRPRAGPRRAAREDRAGRRRSARPGDRRAAARDPRRPAAQAGSTVIHSSRDVPWRCTATSATLVPDDDEGGWPCL